VPPGRRRPRRGGDDRAEFARGRCPLTVRGSAPNPGRVGRTASDELPCTCSWKNWRSRRLASWWVVEGQSPSTTCFAHAIAPRAATGHRHSTRPRRTPTYQS
jgi:hypothetical protein